MTFLHYCDVHCSPKVNLKGYWLLCHPMQCFFQIFQLHLLKKDISDFQWKHTHPQKVRKWQCQFSQVITVCEVYFKNNFKNDISHFEPVISGRQNKRSEPTENEYLQIFVICFQIEQTVAHFLYCQLLYTFQYSMSVKQTKD